MDYPNLIFRKGPLSLRDKSEEKIAEFELNCKVIGENPGPRTNSASRPLIWYCVKLRILF